jgi:hypothetical protein
VVDTASNAAAAVTVCGITIFIIVTMTVVLTRQIRLTRRRTRDLLNRDPADGLPPSGFGDAYSTAERLLLSYLNPVQARDYRERRRFGVTGSNGGCYIINCNGISGNVIQVHPGGRKLRGDSQACEVMRCCAYPDPTEDGPLPSPDIWLAQMLEIRCSELNFLKIASTVPYWMPAAEFVYQNL